MRTILSVGVVALVLAGCGGGITAGERLRMTNPAGTVDAVLNAIEVNQQGTARYEVFLVAKGAKPAEGDSLGVVTWRSTRNAPAMPVMTWLTEDRLELRFTPDHSHTISPSKTVNEKEIKITFKYLDSAGPAS